MGACLLDAGPHKPSAERRTQSYISRYVYFAAVLVLIFSELASKSVCVMSPSIPNDWSKGSCTTLMNLWDKCQLFTCIETKNKIIDRVNQRIQDRPFDFSLIERIKLEDHGDQARRAFSSIVGLPGDIENATDRASVVKSPSFDHLAVACDEWKRKNEATTRAGTRPSPPRTLKDFC